MILSHALCKHCFIVSIFFKEKKTSNPDIEKKNIFGNLQQQKIFITTAFVTRDQFFLYFDHSDF